MRSPRWWKELAQFNIEVVFAVDGLKGKHELYRKNTKFEKVIENLKAFIDAGGNARVDSLVFAHNETDTALLKDYLLKLGVKHVNFISTTRFYEMTEYEVHDNEGNVEYTIKPAMLPPYKRTPNKSLNALVDKEYRDNAIKHAVITPRCVNEIYVDPYGSIFPCCWIGGDYLEEPIEETLPIHYLRNLSVANTKEVLKDVGVPKCQDSVLGTNVNLFEKLDKYWQNPNKCMTCARQCSKLVYDNNNKYTVG
jgi:sulfatase maturation enzyme AslB (radical SAM superfamily)